MSEKGRLMNMFTGQIMCRCGLNTLDVTTGQCYNDSCGYYNPMMAVQFRYECKKQYNKKQCDKKGSAGFLAEPKKG